MTDEVMTRLKVEVYILLNYCENVRTLHTDAVSVVRS